MRSFRGLIVGGGFFRRGCGGKGGTAGESSISEEEFGSPAQDHAECKQIKESASLLKREEAVKKAAGEVARDGQHDHDGKKRTRPLHHDDAVLKMEVGGEQQRIGEDDGADEECAEAPGPWDAKGRDDEHAEACGHAEGRHHDLLERHGAAALANAPGKHAGETDERH